MVRPGDVDYVVMWRGYAHRVGLLDLLRLRRAGWVAEAIDDPVLHLGVVHAVLEFETPQAAARHLDEEAAARRDAYLRARARRDRLAGVTAETSPREPLEPEEQHEPRTTRARDAARARRRQRA